MNKIEKLQLLNKSVCSCTKCPELVANRKNTVLGDGNPNSRIVFIGEAPGKDEDESGIPFVGKAGKLLTNILSAANLDRKDIYIMNVIKCRPPGNRNPAIEEIANCKKFFDLQLQVINPRIIICMGSVATCAILGTTEGITALRGQWFKYNDIDVKPTFHPAYALRQGDKIKKQIYEDIIEAKGKLKNVNASN